MLISNSLQKVTRKKLLAKKLQKNGVFDFYYCRKSFRRMPSLGWTLLHCFLRIQTQLPNFAFYDTLIDVLQFFLYYNFLLNFKPNADETAEITKNVFYKCVSESHFTSIFIHDYNFSHKPVLFGRLQQT
jgi:hypothetical protein